MKNDKCYVIVARTMFVFFAFATAVFGLVCAIMGGPVVVLLCCAVGLLLSAVVGRERAVAGKEADDEHTRNSG